ncbi:RNA demethylase ALKBH9B-like [Gastrolobium bilobum]|uniref:RNA demethylase ALKBH9B-like n=1 Tax=Gastrolobium bilobum TaxID=150636 RepID=UPI002AAF207C|nr:RNA demethylase ALKBH9B-like [Gastrolobium bilobum]
MEMLSSLKKEEILDLLTDGFCHHCESLLHSRIQSLRKRKMDETLYSDEGFESFRDAEDMPVNGNASNPDSLTRSLRNQLDRPRNSSQRHDSDLSMRDNKSTFDYLPKYLESCKQSDSDLLLNDGIGGGSSSENGLSEDQKECIRYSQVHSKKDFSCIDRVNGREINVLQGLELHTGVFNSLEQNKIVECIYRLEWRGKQGKLRERTYSEPKKWMRGKGRVTIQFGCCYNYAVDKNGNPPGILRDEEVDPLPPLFKQMIKRMVRWNIVPSTCIPDSCIVNIYDEGDCIPPHIDHHDFVRPFFTVSFLNECRILLGSNLQVVAPGEFSGPASIPLPIGSVFVLNGNGANVAKHCIPSVKSKRISITFRKMDESKLPYKFSPYPDLVGIKPFIISPPNKPVIGCGKVGNLKFQQRSHIAESESESDTVSKAGKEIVWSGR